MFAQENIYVYIMSLKGCNVFPSYMELGSTLLRIVLTIIVMQILCCSIKYFSKVITTDLHDIKITLSQPVVSTSRS